MLVLSRYRDESIYIGDDVVITVVDIRGDRVRIGVQAPSDVTVHRQEVYEAIKHGKTREQNTRESSVPVCKSGQTVSSVKAVDAPLRRELSKRKEKKLQETNEQSSGGPIPGGLGVAIDPAGIAPAAEYHFSRTETR